MAEDKLWFLIKVILALFLPPLAVFLHVGFNNQFWINLLLTILLFIPGMIHALYIITMKPQTMTRGVRTDL